MSIKITILYWWISELNQLVDLNQVIKFHQDTIHSQILHVDDRQFFQFFQVFLTHIDCFTVAVYPSKKKVGSSTLATCFGSECIFNSCHQNPPTQ